MINCFNVVRSNPASCALLNSKFSDEKFIYATFMNTFSFLWTNGLAGTPGIPKLEFFKLHTEKASKTIAFFLIMLPCTPAFGVPGVPISFRRTDSRVDGFDVQKPCILKVSQNFSDIFICPISFKSQKIFWNIINIRVGAFSRKTGFFSY